MRLIYTQAELQKLIENDVRSKLGNKKGNIDYMAIEIAPPTTLPAGTTGFDNGITLVTESGQVSENVSLVVDYYEEQY